jgi:hypothetical protein
MERSLEQHQKAAIESFTVAKNQQSRSELGSGHAHPMPDGDYVMTDFGWVPILLWRQLESMRLRFLDDPQASALLRKFCDDPEDPADPASAYMDRHKVHAQ